MTTRNIGAGRSLRPAEGRELPEGGVRVYVGDRSPVLPLSYTEPDWDTGSGRQQFTAVNA
ncbi:hypothetical protein GCM10010344_02100 [Streptomyces bluensis]|nr:hypothetical protein GCM10010344_02100 [Streptomyces bluensis]